MRPEDMRSKSGLEYDKFSNLSSKEGNPKYDTNYMKSMMKNIGSV